MLGRRRDRPQEHGRFRLHPVAVSAWARPELETDPYRRRAQYEAMIAAPAQAHLKVLRLRRPRDAGSVESWLTSPEA